MRGALRPLALLGYLSVFGLGLLGGLALGLPGMVERVGGGAISRLEDRLGVTVSAEYIDWSYDGTVVARGLKIVDRWAPPGEPPLLLASRLEVESSLSLSDRRVTLERITLDDPDVNAVVRGAGRENNLIHIARGLRQLFGGHGEGAARAGGGLSYISRALPEVILHRVTLRVDAPIPKLPLGLEVPDRISFSGGEVTLSPEGEGADQALSLRAEFSETSLDPGHGLGVELSLRLDGRLEALGVHFDRPVRFYLGARVAGLRSARWTPDALELGQIQLSVPLDPDKRYDSVGAAATIERLKVSPEPRALLARIGGPLPDSAHLGAWLKGAARALDRVELYRPALVLRIGASGHHSLEDLLPPLQLSGASAAQRAPPLEAESVLSLLTDAALSASARLTRGAASRGSDSSSLRRRVGEGLARIEARVEGIGALLSAALERLPNGAVEITEGRLELLLGGRRLDLERVALELRRDAEGSLLKVAFEVPEVTRRPATLSARRDGRSGDLEVDLNLAGLPLPLVAEWGPLPLVSSVSDGVLYEARVHLTQRLKKRRAELRGVIKLEDAVVSAPSLASAPLKSLDLDVDFQLTLDGAASRLSLSDMRVRLGELEVALAAEIRDYRRKPRVTLNANLAETPVQTIVDALPRAVLSRLDGLTVNGTLAWDLHVDLDTVDIDALVIDSRPVLRRFKVLSLGERIDFDQLRRSFSYPIIATSGAADRRRTGPLTSAWVPLEEMSPYLAKAVTTTEDGRFYRHNGLSTAAIRESLITDLEQGRFARGGSTITQQLVKNLYLGPDKTIARKLQELFVAWRLEKALSKDEIMALYLNIIELGPGIYGVGEAAAHWFGKDAADLSPLEAIFLSSIIPNPRRYYRYFEQGRVSPRWRNYLRTLLGIMVDRGKLTRAEADAQAPYDPLFRGQTRATAGGSPPEDLPRAP